ncbi:hypothetical protein [Limnoglobus roseus]|uniref:Uncharacterized protein n=1 Tax=Limnoglobus roseus TaxID=2598579 RepID=A0A5C1APH1_9BACT|nr:hypothetical protein [Limnoglobus roseus]QEL19916.1 hypothetical protein PX52LOC_06998 [Limnoglobus roseus]
MRVLFLFAALSLAGCSRSNSPPPPGRTKAELEARGKEDVKRRLDEERIKDQEIADVIKRTEDQNRAAKQLDEAVK